jgi:hypothetical protein
MTRITGGFYCTPAGAIVKFYPGPTTVISTPPAISAGSATVGTADYGLPASNAIYISPTGSDSNPGTVASPKQTLKAALTAATSGTTIVMRAGSYNEGADTQTGGTATDSRAAMTSQLGGLFNSTKTNIFIQNYPGEAVWIDGSTTFDTSWTHDGTSGLWWHTYDRRMDRSHTESSGATDDGSGGAASGGSWVSNALNPNAAIPDMIVRDGVELKVVGSQAAVVAGTVYIEGNALTSPNANWFQGTKVWIADDPTGHEMRYGNKNMLWQFNIGPLTVRGIGIRRYATHVSAQGCMYMQGGAFTFENVWLEHISAVAIKGVQGSPSMPRTFKNVTAHYIGFGFLGGGNDDNLTVDSCDFQYNNYRNFNPGGPTAAIIKVNGTQGATITGSVFANSNCTGFWTDRTCNNINIVNSWFQHLGDQTGGFIGNGVKGLDIEGASNGVVANCVITDIGGIGIWNNDSSAMRYYNNTIANTHRQSVDSTGKITGGGPFTIGQSDRRAINPAYSWMLDGRQGSTAAGSYYDPNTFPDHNYQCNSFVFENNVVVQNGNGNGGAQGIFSCQSGGDTWTSATYPQTNGTTRNFAAFGPQMDANVWWFSVTPQYPWIATKGSGQNPTIYPSLAGFRTGTGLEANGTQPASNPVNGSYQLLDTTLHAKAVPLPADIATLVGHLSGTKRAGAFIVGDA